MIQFYKKRSFGDFVADTFNFLKIYGKNYFKNYLLINGLLLILMMFLMVLGLKDIFAYFMEGTIPDSSFVEDYFSENVGLLVAVFAIMFLLFLVAMVVNYAYPVFYIKRTIETNVKSIKLDDIFGDIKANLGKLFIFLVGLIFIVGPLATIVIGLSYVLVFIIIGFFLLILVTPVVMNSINFLLFDYLNTSRGFFASLSYAIRSQFSYPHHSEGTPFWKYWGATTVLYILIQVVTSVFTIIPFIFFGISQEVFSSASEMDANIFPIIIIITYSISIIISFVVSNLIYICTGFMYYDSRTDLHRTVDLTEIDSIGKNEL